MNAAWYLVEILTQIRENLAKNGVYVALVQNMKDKSLSHKFMLERRRSYPRSTNFFFLSFFNESDRLQSAYDVTYGVE